MASAGGLRALTAVLSRLPGDFPAAIVVVQHLDPNRPSLLAEILGRQTGLPVRQAADGDRLRPGAVFVAPPAHHLLVNGDGVALADPDRAGPLRPPLGRPAVRVGRPRASATGPIAVVLTGPGTDGADGRPGRQADGRDGHRAGPADLAVLRDARRRDPDRLRRLVLPLDEIAPALSTSSSAGAHDRAR